MKLGDLTRAERREQEREQESKYVCTHACQTSCGNRRGNIGSSRRSLRGLIWWRTGVCGPRAEDVSRAAFADLGVQWRAGARCGSRGRRSAVQIHYRRSNDGLSFLDVALEISSQRNGCLLQELLVVYASGDGARFTNCERVDLSVKIEILQCISRGRASGNYSMLPRTAFCFRSVANLKIIVRSGTRVLECLKVERLVGHRG